MRIDFFPAHLEFAELFALIVDLCARPIASAARTLDAIHIVAGERGILGAPGPKIGRDFVERTCVLRVKSRGSEKKNRNELFHV